MLWNCLNNQYIKWFPQLYYAILFFSLVVSELISPKNIIMVYTLLAILPIFRYNHCSIIYKVRGLHFDWWLQQPFLISWSNMKLYQRDDCWTPGPNKYNLHNILLGLSENLCYQQRPAKYWQEVINIVSLNKWTVPRKDGFRPKRAILYELTLWVGFAHKRFYPKIS